MADKGFGIKELNLIGAAGVPTIESPNNLNLNAVNVAISTDVSVGGDLSIAGVAVTTYDGSWVLGANGTADYTFTGTGLNGTVNDPTIHLQKGNSYIFKNRSGGHPFRIQSTSGTGGTPYNTGVTNNAGGNGTDIIFEVPHDVPSTLYYQCTMHTNMSGTIDTGTSSSELATQIASVNSDITSVRTDVSKLALQIAVETNRAAYNLTDSFIDQFEDSTGISATTDTQRNTSGEFVWAAAEGNVDVGGTLTQLSSSNVTTNAGYWTVQANSDVTFIAGASYNYSWRATGAPLTGKYWVRCKPLHTWTNPGASPPSGNDSPGFQFGIDRNDAASWSYGNSIWNRNDNNFYYFCSRGAANSRHEIMIGGSRQNFANHNITNSEYYYFVRDTAGSGSLKLYRNNFWGAAGGALIHTYNYTGTQDDAFGCAIGYPNGENVADNVNVFGDVSWKSGITTLAGGTVVNATGTVIGSANVPSTARTKVSGVMLYKNENGTATLGTDLKIFFTCNGGTNWTEVSGGDMTTGTDFSSGIKTVYLAEQECTSGQDVRYKAVWANQASGTKETQLHGIALNY